MLLPNFLIALVTLLFLVSLMIKLQCSWSTVPSAIDYWILIYRQSVDYFLPSYWLLQLNKCICLQPHLWALMMQQCLAWLIQLRVLIKLRCDFSLEINSAPFGTVDLVTPTVKMYQICTSMSTEFPNFPDLIHYQSVHSASKPRNRGAYFTHYRSRICGRSHGRTLWCEYSEHSRTF